MLKGGHVLALIVAPKNSSLALTDCWLVGKRSLDTDAQSVLGTALAFNTPKLMSLLKPSSKLKKRNDIKT